MNFGISLKSHIANARLICRQFANLALHILLLAVLLVANGDGLAARKGNIELDPQQRVSFRSGKDTIHGQLYAPTGAGPFAAVVLLHDYYGLHETHRKWAERLVTWGYVAFLVDSYGPRGLKTGENMGGLTRGGDAYAAMAYLQRLKNVDPKRIGMIGWSRGGDATLMALSATSENPAVPEHFKTGSVFRAGIAYYPGCRVSLYYAPLLILVGDQDNISGRFESCRNLAATSKAGGKPIQFVGYPGASHVFDYGIAYPNWLGKPIIYDAKAERDAIERVKAFLAENL